LSKLANNSRGADRSDCGEARTGPPDIVRALRREILDGVHPPGVWLREQPLAARFGVSRGPVREALRLLGEERLVESEPFRGARVARLSRAEIVEIMELRAALFALAARFAAERAPESALEEFRREIDTMVTMVETGATPFELLAQGGRATAIVVEHCGAPDVQTVLRQVTRKSQWHYTQVGIGTFVAAREAARYWQEVARAICAREPAKTEQAVRRVLGYVEKCALAALDSKATIGQDSP